MCTPNSSTIHVRPAGWATTKYVDTTAVATLKKTTGGGQKLRTGSLVLPVADNILSECILPLFCLVLGLKRYGQNLHQYATINLISGVTT